jgi:hypothetical protein
MMGFNLERSVAPTWAQALAKELNATINLRFRRPTFDLYPKPGEGAQPLSSETVFPANGDVIPAPGTGTGKARVPTDGFSVIPALPGATQNPFILRPVGPDFTKPNPNLVFVGAGGKQSVFNRWHGPAGGPGGAERNFFAAPMRSVHDHLMFVESHLGRGYYLNQRDIAMYQLEPDPKFYVGSTMAGSGRHVLFEVVNPSPQVRMVLEFSTSLKADLENKLPPALAIGDRRSPFPITGRGSARVFSPAMAPQVVEGRPLVALDMGQDAGPFPQRRTGLMRLYGWGFNMDYRQLTGFARDISLVSEQQYAALQAPPAVQSFPKDFQNPQLEYSGAYEDGWLSDWAWLAVAQPWNASELVIKGTVPKVNDPNFTTDMTVLVDGKEMGRKTVGVDFFEYRLPVPALAADGTSHAPGRRKVELKFSRYQQLPLPDGRPVSFHIGFLGFETAPAPPTLVRDFSAAMGDKMLEPAGLDGDGWLAPRASMRLTQPPDRGQLVVRGMVPRVPGGNAFASTVTLTLDGKKVAEQRLGLGDFELRVDAPRGPGLVPAPHKVDFEFSDAQRLPAPDSRTVGAKLTSIGFERPPEPPSWVSKFPEDLKNPLLGATGMSDDRWAAPTVTAKLSQPADAGEFVVRGMVPQVAPGAPASTDVVVVIDGREAGRQTVAAGPFELRITMPLPTGQTAAAHQVELRFSNPQTLPAPDGRTIGAQLTAFGFPPAVSEW